MKAIYKLVNPDEMQASMTITMSISDWKELAEVVGKDYPGAIFSNMISKLVRDAEQHFYEEHETNGY